MQIQQQEWAWQWERLYDAEEWLLKEWIAPNTLEMFEGKDVLDCGSGCGQHINFVAPHCRHIVGVDLNSAEIARKNTAKHLNVEIFEGDIATMDLERQFQIVYCIGVLHHTDDPEKTFENLVRHCAPGGRLILWVYSYEGNFWNRTLLETIKRFIITNLPRRAVWLLGHLLTALLYIPIYSLYLLPFPSLPFYSYFQNWRRLSYQRNFLNVFDKLNAPQTHFIAKEQLERWFGADRFCDVHISPYVGVSWRASGTKK